MTAHNTSPPSNQIELFGGRKPHWLLVVVLFVSAFGVRIWRIDEPLLDLPASRQYRAAIIARAWYWRGIPSIPKWRKEIAESNKDQCGLREPPVLELLAVVSYRISGGERLWIPRVLSIAFWMVGGIFLYELVKRCAGGDAALVSSAFYLFAPFGVFASRAFMVDPLMASLLIAALFYVVRYSERPSARRFIAASAVSAVAVLSKPLFCLIPLSCAFAVLDFSRRQDPLRKTAVRVLLFLILLLGPTLIYLGFMFVTGHGSKILEARSVLVVPALLTRPFFWAGWLTRISQVVGLPAFLASLVGVAMLHEGVPRRAVLGLWIGYFVYGLALSWATYTHNYYHLQLVPIVAVSVGPLAAGVARQAVLAFPFRRVRSLFACVLLLVGVFLAVYTYVHHRRTVALAGLSGRQRRSESFLYVVNPDFERFVTTAREIGELVQHSKKALFTGSAFGHRYYGEFSGRRWPTHDALRAGKQRGTPELSAPKRFKTEYAAWSPEYFIIVNPMELNAQPDLKQFLERNFRLIRRTEDYIVYDLRRRKPFGTSHAPTGARDKPLRSRHIHREQAPRYLCSS